LLFPGVFGAICLLLGLWATQVLPVNYTGLALMALGLVLMAAEAFTYSRLFLAMKDNVFREKDIQLPERILKNFQ